MTAHYKESVTADQIIEAWNDYGLPPAYATITQADVDAYNCWSFLYCRKSSSKMTVEEFIGSSKGPAIERFKKLIPEVLIKLKSEVFNDNEKA